MGKGFGCYAVLAKGRSNSVVDGRDVGSKVNESADGIEDDVFRSCHCKGILGRGVVSMSRSFNSTA